MRNRLLFILATMLLTSIHVQAQEKLFEEALNKGRKAGEYYVIDNGKTFKLSKAEEYANKQSIFIGPSSGKDDNNITRLEFLPINEYPDYIQENLSLFNSVPPKE